MDKDNVCSMCDKAVSILEWFHFGVCINPKCPNYGLLQVSDDEMISTQIKGG